MPWTIAALLIAAPDPAEEDRVIEWRAPAACPTADEVDARLRQLVPQAQPASLRAEAVVEAHEGGWRLQVELRSASGVDRRSLEAARCEVLAEAAAFIVAVGLDPAIAGGAEPSPPSPEVPIPAEPEPPPRAAPRVPRDATPAAPSPRRAAVRGALRAGFEVGHRVATRLDLAPSLWAAIVGRRWRAELGARYVVGRTQTITDLDDATLAIQGGGVTARGCPVFPVGAIELTGCAGLDLAALVGQPSGVEDPRRRVSLRVAADVAAALVWPMTPRIAWWLELESGFALWRPRFDIRGRRDPIYVAPVASVVGRVGVEVRLGPVIRRPRGGD